MREEGKGKRARFKNGENAFKKDVGQDRVRLGRGQAASEIGEQALLGVIVVAIIVITKDMGHVAIAVVIVTITLIVTNHIVLKLLLLLLLLVLL